jgi:hypothetical protein
MAKDRARNNFPFCCPIARYLRLLLNRGILDPSASLGTGSEQLRLQFRSIVATQSTAHLAIKFRNLFHARS